MYEKTIKFKLEKKFFNKYDYLDNKYIYEWLTLARKYFLNSLGIDIDSLGNYGFYYTDIEIRIYIKNNIKLQNKDLFIKTTLAKHNGIKSIFNYEAYIDGQLLLTASSTHNVLRSDSDRAVRMDRYLPKWDQILKDVVNNEL
ncbi:MULTISPECIES: hypothetical protein [unclassified Gemella]|uniref:hypothetical protein n=1 Tax=unclassified Gemella TaxID=2624949 RepID=UPI001C055A32|nr:MULTISPECIES: hypothetical protein [unclassified Gemella]MBU0278676.1 hypothetical protein [Gemella sp. zg-1178]QWQ39231.1 hypothetical protein KMP11_02575 [Gemella sp. zg-570]